MTKRILVAVDGSPSSEAAVEFVTAEWPDAEIVLLHVIDPVESSYRGSALPTEAEAWYETARADAEEELATFAVQVERETGETPETAVVVGRPASSIVEAAADVDHVAMGSHGRTGVSRIVLGSVAEAVVRRSPVPVTIVR